MAYTNSKLVSKTLISPNRTSQRNHAIDTITIHCYVGQVTVERGLEGFSKVSRNASCNYVIGYDGKIGLCCPESDRSWCTSNAVNDNRSITIEVASDTKSPYAVNAEAYNALIKLVADICERNGIKKLVWSTNKKDRVGHLNGCNMTVHRDFANKACPGQWLYDRHGEIAAKVNAILNGKTEEKKETKYTVHFVKDKWQAAITTNTKNYVGGNGKEIDGVAIQNAEYVVHQKGMLGGKWLPRVNGYNLKDDINGYAGNIGKPIDAIAIRGINGTKIVKYRVMVKGGKWLPWVTGYNTKDKNNGYAGNIGQAIYGIQIVTA